MEVIQTLTSAVEKHQRRTETENLFPADREAILAAQAARVIFHEALRDDARSNSDLAALAEASADLMFGSPGEQDIVRLRANLAEFPIGFTNAEPPGSATFLAQSFRRVGGECLRDRPNARFLFATDCTYRPHASVQEWADEQYLILMGRYLLADLPTLSRIIAAHMIEAAEPSDATPWLNREFPKALRTAFEQSEFRWRFPYMLAAASEGERFRVALPFPSDSLADEIVGNLHAGAIDFIVGHEVAHVLCGHLGRDLEPPGTLPSYLQYALQSVRARGPEGSRLADYYMTACWPQHDMELTADAMALFWSGKSGAPDRQELRLMGAQLAICLIAFLDRATHLRRHGQDPAVQVGLEFYSVPGLVDILMPKESHPWGKTRATAINSMVEPMFEDRLTREDLRHKSSLMLEIQYIFSKCAAEAMSVSSFVQSKPGELLAMAISPTELRTLVLPPGGGPESEMLNSDPSRYYLDVWEPEVVQFRKISDD